MRIKEEINILEKGKDKVWVDEIVTREGKLD
jgi:hypothetical protein